MGAAGGAVAGGAVAGATPRAAVSVATALPTSLTTTAGTWASVPMGHLRQRLDTFWQLFFLPSQGGNWTNHASQLGIADNGGLLLAARGDRSLVVAIRPSNRLRYSAVVTTADGRSWTPATALQGSAGSLAAGPNGRELVLVQDSSGGRVLDGSGSGWHPLVTARSLAATASGRLCGTPVLTAVAFDNAGEPVVGASCGHGGVVGLFADESGTWRSIVPIAPSSAGSRPIEVVSVQTIGGRLSALLAVASRSGTRLVEGWLAPGGGWQESGSLSLGGTGRIISIGQAPSGTEFVLYAGRKDREHLATIGGPAASWTHLPDPPAGTATVAFPAAGRVDALAVDNTVMTDWVLDAGTAYWAKHQVAHVQILFGSSTT